REVGSGGGGVRAIVLLDALGDFEGEGEGGGALASADLGLGSGLGAGEEVGELALEGFALFDGNGFPQDFASGEFADESGVGGGEELGEEGALFLVGFGEAVDEAFLAHVVEGEVAVLLEDADFPESLGADARGGEVGDAAVFEAESGVGDVLATAEDGDADGVDGVKRGANQVEDDFEVVDHEIQHDADFGAAIGVGGEAVAFDETGLMQAGFEGGENGVEAFDVPDLEGEVLRLGQGDECLRVGGAFGDGLFNEHVFPALEQARTDGVMEGGGGGDGGGVNGFDEFLEGGGRAGAVGGGDLASGVEIGVVDAGEIGSCDFREDARVKASDVAGADDSDTRVHGGYGERERGVRQAGGRP
ncbi:MAG: hypothetical protein RLZZ244_2885, partial [Verrucomicrobiota bacterium]